MRLATLRTPDGTQAVRVAGDGNRALPLPYRDVGELLASGPDWRAEAAAATGRPLELDPSYLAPVVPAPAKFVAVGFNFTSHTDDRTPGQAYPSLFTKFARSLVGARDDIELPLPEESVQVDWEVELAVVIGRPGRRIPAARAREHIAGYTVTNDLSVRDWQFRTRQALAGKAWEHMTPLGPWLVSADEAPDAAGMRLRCEVDGVLRQDASTAEMIFSAEEVVAYLSTIVMLEPGDVISLGTPAGAAIGQDPPPWLTAGAVVRSSVEGIGELVNRCAAAPAPAPATAFAATVGGCA